MADVHSGRGLRLRAIGVVLALVVVGCNGSDAEPEQSDNDPSAMVTAALGGTQAVQDFLIHLDMQVETADGYVSYYDEVLDAAAAGAGDPVSLNGGLTFSPVISLEGNVVDSDGESLSTIALDFALIEGSPQDFATSKAQLVDELARTGNTETSDLIATADVSRSRMLVEMVTADYVRERTHAAAGDLAALDLTSVSSIAPGDAVASIYLFGQTLPGDPQDEAGLSAHDLFVYRWNRGLVSIFGTEEGVSPIADGAAKLVRAPSVSDSSLDDGNRWVHDTSRAQPQDLAIGAIRAPVASEFLPFYGGYAAEEPPAVSGDGADDTILVQEIKKLAAMALGAEEGRQMAEWMLANPNNSEIGYCVGQVCISPPRPDWQTVAPYEPVVTVAFLAGTTYLDFEDGRVLGEMSPGMFVGLGMVIRATERCQAILTEMLLRNEAAINMSNEPGRTESITTGPTDADPDSAEVDDGLDSRTAAGNRARELCPGPLPESSVGGTFGDVHITTFDGWSYDNQAVGELLVFDNGVATVQMRLAPWEDSDAVSVVTAVAVGVGDHKVSMHQGGRIWIDGKEPQLARGESIGVGDAALLSTGTGWFIVWPDGTEVRVTGGQADPFGDPATPSYSNLVVLIYPSDRPTVGMIGTPDGDGSNDWVTRSGEQLTPQIRFDFENFYASYVDTWRISQDESLFHYEQGENTDTFTVDGFPRVRYDLADLDPQAVAEARAACLGGGIERPEIIDDCALDVALTGDYRFVFDAYAVDSSTVGSVESVPESVSGPTEAGENLVTVGPLSVGFGADPPVALPNSAVQWQCQAAEGSLFATSRFQESQDRSYRVLIEYLDAAASGTGDERFTMIVELDGTPVAWMQTTVEPMAGSLDSVTLTGSTLAASGTAVLNQPPDPALYPGSALPPGTEFEPFVLQVDCSR